MGKAAGTKRSIEMKSIPGCEGCSKTCKYNGNNAALWVQAASERYAYGCNNKGIFFMEEKI